MFTVIETNLRTPGSTVAFDIETGNVRLRHGNQPPVDIACCDPGAPVYQAFAEFWGNLFHGFGHYLSLNRLVDELADGTLIQDQDCPFLFIDTSRVEFVGVSSNEPSGHPLIHVHQDGQVTDYSPVEGAIGYALISNHRVKLCTFFSNASGFWRKVAALGLTLRAGDTPAFDTNSLAGDAETILQMASELLANAPDLLPASEETYPFLDDQRERQELYDIQCDW